MTPIAMTNITRPTATKRKAGESTTTNSSAAKRQMTSPRQLRPRKPAKASGAAKPPSSAQSASASSSSGGVANNTPPASTLTTTLPPASPDASSIAAAPQTSTLQVSVATAASASNAPLPAPAYNPGACFSQDVPTPFAPWPHNFPAPTPRFTHPLPSCPVNWSAITGLTAEQKEAYELRAPWNPNPTTFTIVRQTTRFLPPSKQVPSEECVRKRFKKACLAIFKCSGVYFEETALGLEEYGVPKQAELRNLIGDVVAATLPTPAPTPASTASAATSSTDTVSFTVEPTPAPLHPRPTRVDREASIYAGKVVAFQLQTAEDDCPTLRVCDKRLVPNDRILHVYNVTVDLHNNILVESKVPTLPFSTPAFDRWHASVCFGNARTFPRREYVCREIYEGEYLLRDHGKPSEGMTTIALMLETYAVSQAMGTRTASRMMLREIVRKLRSAPVPVLGAEKEAFLGHLAVDDPMFDAVASFRCFVTSDAEDELH